MVDIDANEPALRVEVQHNAGRDLARLCAGPLGQIDVERVGLGVVMELHGWTSLKPRSGKALCTVSPSSSVTTRRYFWSSGTQIQYRTRPSPCTSRCAGLRSASSPHSRRISGRFRKTC